MTEKIIIDDVQIIGCEHYWNGTCHAYVDNTGKFLLCVKSPNCYFKQLKRKEQKLDKIRDIILECTNSRNCNNCKYVDECDKHSSNSEMMLDVIGR